MKGCKLLAPSSGQKNGITGQQECVSSMAQLEHQAVWIDNLELMSQRGCDAWKVYTENLLYMIEHAQKELHKLKKHIQDLNWQWKNMQLTAGSKLREMKSNWVSLVSRNEETERTIVQSENEVFQTKQQHGEANKEDIQHDFWKDKLSRGVERRQVGLFQIRHWSVEDSVILEKSSEFFKDHKKWTVTFYLYISKMKKISTWWYFWP